MPTEVQKALVVKTLPTAFITFLSYSIAWFKNESAAIQAVNEITGKFINGCVLLVKPFTGSSPVLDEAKPANVAREEKLPGVCYPQDLFLF
jgi:hypothetical protein